MAMSPVCVDSSRRSVPALRREVVSRLARPGSFFAEDHDQEAAKPGEEGRIRCPTLGGREKRREKRDVVRFGDRGEDPQPPRGEDLQARREIAADVTKAVVAGVNILVGELASYPGRTLAPFEQGSQAITVIELKDQVPARTGDPGELKDRSSDIGNMGEDLEADHRVKATVGKRQSGSISHNIHFRKGENIHIHKFFAEPLWP